MRHGMKDVHCTLVLLLLKVSPQPRPWAMEPYDAASIDEPVSLTQVWASAKPSSISGRKEKSPMLPGMKPLRSIRKYGQYHRPIALPILFWLNGVGGNSH